MLTKKELEKREASILAPYACLSKNSLGRQHKEDPSISRTEFQRDKDRVIHSKAFRRLIHKTQVFVTTEGDHYRNRLTHTLEVSQIGRHLARTLALNEDLAETIALAHDLGHTPFGHTGEEILNELMKENGGFEHNRQSKKIVEKLEKKYIGFDGLNLTHETIDGLIKHRSPYDNSGKTTDTGPSLEAQLVNFADEVAYNSHDTDDAITAKIINQDELYKKTTIWKELTDTNKKKYTNLTNKELQNLNIRQIINFQINDLVSETERLIKKNNIKNYQDVLKTTGLLVAFSNENQEKIKELRNYLYKNFYQNKNITQKVNQAKEIITGLFNYYKKHPEKTQESSMFIKNSTPEELVTNYIAGMTDQYAINRYKDIKL